MELEEIKELVKKEFKGFQITNIRKYDGKYYVYLEKKGAYDIPVLWFSNSSDDKGTLDMTDDLAHEILEKGEKMFEQERNDDKMELDEKKVRDLLKRYGAEDEEIENFMEDLIETKEDIKEAVEEDDEEYLLNPETVEKLKLTEKGQDLIINAPKMAKDELAKAIKECLTKD